MFQLQQKKADYLQFDCKAGCLHSPAGVRIKTMNSTESSLRAIKDKIAAAMGELDESASRAHTKENHARLTKTARDLYQCADEMQKILMRIRVGHKA
jgi:hypothetical protein